MGDTPDRAFIKHHSIAEGTGGPAPSEELETVVGIAQEAGEILLSYFSRDRMETQAKGDRDVVTAADMAAEAFVRRRLTESFPGDGILGEEGTDVAATGGRRWCVDPLDGTLNYSRTLPIWGVSIALFEGKRPVLGVVHDPTRNETFAAAKGSGAYCNGSRMETSDIEAVEDGFVHMSVDFHDGSMQEGLEDLAIVAPRVLRTRNIGSAALALAYVAAGRLDAMLHRYANPWDYGAGVVLVQEAGGKVTNMAGEEYAIEDLTMLAAGTPSLHTGLLELIRNPKSER